MQLPSGQRREVIEDLLDLQIFTTMNSLLKDRVQQNNEELINITADQKVIMEKIKLIQKHLEEKQSNNEKLITEKVEIIEETNTKITDLDTKYWDFDKKISELKSSIEDKESITSKINKLTQLKHKIEAKKALIENDIKFFENHDGCPTCKQTIDENFKVQTLDTKKDEIDKIETGLVELYKQYEEANDRLTFIMDLTTEINNNNMEQYKCKNQIDSLIKYREQLDREINNINQVQEADESEKHSELQEEMELVANRYNDSMDEKQILSAASMLLKDGGIKARIIKQYVPVINKLINKYLSSMDFFVQFELDEEFNETIKSRFRDEFSYASFSEGEKMRINLAILFTWRAVAKLRNSVSTNLLILDEVMDSSLDSNGTEEFLKIILQLVQDTNTFIISHKTDQLYDKFSNIIRFEKKQNFSKVA
jgi:DNA repair exonuclease SbcCD ATPase subunit